MRSLVQQRLERAGMTQRELSDRLGVHKVTVCRWCSDEGIRSMTIRQLERVADAVGCGVKDLFE